MADFEAIEINGTPAEKAVLYILQRVARDVNFAWYMWNTQALALCLEAEAARRGTTRAVVERDVRMDFDRWKESRQMDGCDEPDVVRLRKEVEKLQAALENTAEYDIDEMAVFFEEDFEPASQLDREVEFVKDSPDPYGLHGLREAQW